MKKVIVSVTNDLSFDQRVKRICEVLQELDYDILLQGRLLNTSTDYNPNYRISRIRLPFTKGGLFYASYNMYLFWKLLFTKSNLLYSNDLDTLLPNYLVAKIKGIPLIYDSHELFTEVPEIQGRWVKKVWLGIEKRIFPKLKNIITVNNSIASIYNEKYKVPVNVIRNIPLLNPIQVDNSFFSHENDYLIILQGAGINIDRGAEELVLSMKLVPNATLIIVGSGDVLPQLKELVIQHNLEKVVKFIGKIPPSELKKYTQIATVGVSLDKDTNANYKYSLPNKLFDYIHASTPIVCSNIIEVANIVKQYNLGIVINEVSPKNIADALNNILDDKGRYETYKDNCIEASKILNWQAEKEKLKKILKEYK